MACSNEGSISSPELLCSWLELEGEDETELGGCLDGGFVAPELSELGAPDVKVIAAG